MLLCLHIHYEFRPFSEKGNHFPLPILQVRSLRPTPGLVKRWNLFHKDTRTSLCKQEKLTSQPGLLRKGRAGLSLCFTTIFLCLPACFVCLCLGSYIPAWLGFPGYWISITRLHWISKDRLILWILAINSLGGCNLIGWPSVVQVYALCHFRSGCVWQLVEGFQRQVIWARRGTERSLLTNSCIYN